MDEYLIYPKQFHRTNIAVEKNRCFVIMPFKENMDYIYGIIKQGLNRAGYICNRVDEISGATPIINKILTEILRSSYVIADLTDCNPNVFYELGIAHSFKEASNIVILKQQDSNIPFDVTHLTYIEYDPNNVKLLTSSILKTINENSYLSDFRESLNIRGIIPYIKSNEELFISYIEKEFKKEFTILTSILNNEVNKYNAEDIEDFLLQYEILLGKAILNETDEVIDGVLAIYHAILISVSKFPAAEEAVCRFLDDSFLKRYHPKEEKTNIWKTDLVVELANVNKMLPLVMTWIINYFSQTKTATIDLNRYKLEAFLMNSENNKVNEIICNAIFDENCYIREHMADIIGEKRLIDGLQNLCKQLNVEDNYFTAVSIIEAMGKLRDQSAIPCILNWLQINEQNILSEKQLFVLKHIKIALLKLVNDPNDTRITTFDQKYNIHLRDYIIL
ncbi:MAG: hypothetical protein J1F31_06925 [Erysipelotrichales bacterium]|nr:hypothetical protein [Erysipelotrichales bacterium]